MCLSQRNGVHGWGMRGREKHMMARVDLGTCQIALQVSRAGAVEPDEY